VIAESRVQRFEASKINAEKLNAPVSHGGVVFDRPRVSANDNQSEIPATVLHDERSRGSFATVSNHDHFPTTQQTWIVDRLAEGGHGAPVLRESLMERYREPLLIYVRGSTLRTLGEPDELVHGFFAHFFSDLRNLERWAESGTRLRRWMMNGLVLHARGLRRDAARNREIGSLGAVGERAAEEGDALSQFEAAWARSLLSDAATAVQAELVAEGRVASWEVFRRHIIDGEAYAVCCPPLGLTADDGRTATRMVSLRVRRTLRELLLQEGTPDGEIAGELRALEALLAR